MTSAGRKIYVWGPFAGLNNEAQVRQECQECLVDGSAFANKHKPLHSLQAGRQDFGVTYMFTRDDDLLPIELLKAVERSYGILVVIGNSYLHTFSSNMLV